MGVFKGAVSGGCGLVQTAVVRRDASRDLSGIRRDTESLGRPSTSLAGPLPRPPRGGGSWRGRRLWLTSSALRARRWVGTSPARSIPPKRKRDRGCPRSRENSGRCWFGLRELRLALTPAEEAESAEGGTEQSETGRNRNCGDAGDALERERVGDDEIEEIVARARIASDEVRMPGPNSIGLTRAYRRRCRHRASTRNVEAEKLPSSKPSRVKGWVKLMMSVLKLSGKLSMLPG